MASDFSRSLAYVVGINDYQPPVPPLTTAAGDAIQLAAVLENLHGYAVRLLTKGATVGALLDLRAQMLAEVTVDDRVLFYWAGHGIPPDDTEPRERRAGYLLSQSARLNDKSSCLAMDDLYADFSQLPCRHLLVILDCCYAGRFRWAATRPGRDLEPVPEVPIFAERYRRFVQRNAWQLLTSAGQNEKAADVLFGERGEGPGHSPFAAALLAGLRGEADARRGDGGWTQGDGVIPLYELYAYLERVVADQTEGRQTVSYFPLDRHDTGQYVFLVPGVTDDQLKLPPALPLLAEFNPYLGLARYDFTPEHEVLFNGRVGATTCIQADVEARPLTVVVGPSGSGKSSLVRAGVMRRLAQHADWLVLPPVQPGSAPLVELAKGLAPLAPGRDLANEFQVKQNDEQAVARVVSEWLNSLVGRDRHLLLCIDQFEELITQHIDPKERDHYCRLLAHAVEGAERLHVVVTVRSDYEGQFGRQPSSQDQPPLATLWGDALRVVPPLGRDDMREIVVGPATERTLVFDPPALADELADAVAQQPGALPLLSFTLWKLYRACVERVARTGELEDRRLTREDYEAIGFLTGALSQHADDLLLGLPADEQSTLRRVMLRLVDLAGPEAVKRRVPKDEILDYDQPERGRVERVLGRLEAERLVISGDMVPRADATENVACAEPVHDALIRGWTTLRQWIEDEQNKVRSDPPQALPLIVRRRLTDDALEWVGPGARDGHAAGTEQEQASRRGAEQVPGQTDQGATADRPDLLWHNSPHLTLANRHLVAEPLAFNRTEATFLRASELRRRVRARRIWTGVTGAFALVAGLAVVALILSFLADERAKVAESQRLASQARSEAGPRLPLAHLLSLEAYRVRDTLEARSSLLHGLQRQPALVAQHRQHDRSEGRRAVYDVALSADGLWLASGGADGSVILCNAATGRVDGDHLRGHEGSVYSLAGR